MRWNNCTPVRMQGEMLSIERYKAYKLRHVNSDNVWWDEKCKMAFGSQQDYFTDKAGHSFLAQAEHFIEHPLWGLKYVENYLAKALGGPIASNSEIIWHDSDLLNKYKNSSILIVGAGPSALEIDLASISSDYIWSCNHFFLNKTLFNTKVDLFALGNEVDISCKNTIFREYLNKFPTTTALFETTNRPFKDIQSFSIEFPERSTFAHTRYRSKIGAMPRLIALAALLGASDIIFVGMDGHPLGAKHAFESGKRPQGSPTYDGSYDRWRRQYVVFWDYMLYRLRKNTYFQNLGEGLAGNMSTDISSQEFPLGPIQGRD